MSELEKKIPSHKLVCATDQDNEVTGIDHSYHTSMSIVEHGMAEHRMAEPID